MTATTRQPCAFLDRDDTIIVDRHYLRDPDGVALLPGAAAGLAALRRLGYRLVLVTNQSGVGRGYFTLADVEAVHRRLADLLAAAGVTLDGIYLCPHAPEDGCRCRKPATGMVERACADLGLDPRRSVMIGDKASDVDLARRCGMAAILIEATPGAEPDCQPDARVADLPAAAAWLAAHPRPDPD